MVKEFKMYIDDDFLKSNEGDIIAYNLLLKGGYLTLETHSKVSWTDAGNFIIELAAKIKAQRLSVAARNQRHRKL